MKNKKLKITILILGIILAYSIFGGYEKNIQTDISIEGDPFLGDENAPVTIIEFSDFECPFCAKFHKETFPQIKEKYIDTGKVKFVYKDFPLGSHKNAQKAAEAAECANEQGKFWEFTEKLYETRNFENLEQSASELGIDITECLNSEKYSGEVREDLQNGIDAGVKGTPAFFVNGILFSGAQPFSEFEKIIESQLS